MARLLVEGDDLVVRLSWWEKAAALHADVHVPLAAARRVRVERDWWRALRGVRRRGVSIPGALYAGTRRHRRETDFVAFRPGAPVVCVDLGPESPFRLLSVSVSAPEAAARWLRGLAPELDPRATVESRTAQTAGIAASELTLWPWA